MTQPPTVIEEVGKNEDGWWRSLIKVNSIEVVLDEQHSKPLNKVMCSHAFLQSALPYTAPYLCIGLYFLC